MKHEPYVITPVPLEYLPSTWADIERVLAPAVKTAGGRIGMDDLFLAAADGSTVVWLVLEGLEVVAAFTTRVAEYPKSKTLVIDWVGGKKLFRWIDAAVSVIKDQARANGCPRIEGYGRPAWTRALQRHGVVPEYVAYRMEMSGGYGSQRAVEHDPDRHQ
jgi:hypothetical protein